MDISYRLHPTGVLYNRKEDAMASPRYELRVGLEQPNLLSQISPLEMKLFKPEEGWTESNEPEDHLNEIARELKDQIKLKDFQIGCFSYKDNSLANKISNGCNSTVQYTFKRKPAMKGAKESPMQWPEDCTDEQVCKMIENMDRKFDLYIIRHYLEHFENVDEVIRSIKRCINPNGLIYIEVPSCEEFIQMGNPLFMWEQHRKYFTKASLASWLTRNNLEGIILQKGKSIEPSLCCIVRPDPTRLLEDRSDCKHLVENLIAHSHFENYITSWLKLINSKRYKILLGIGHNSHRFLQLINGNNHFNEYVDSSERKKGMFLAGCETPISNEIAVDTNAEFEIILGVHDRSYDAVASKLSARYEHAKISSIFREYG